MSEPRRGEFRGGPSKPSSVVLRGAAEREDGPATTGLGKTAQEPRAATEGCPYARPVRQVPGRHGDHPSDAGWPYKNTCSPCCQYTGLRGPLNPRTAKGRGLATGGTGDRRGSPLHEAPSPTYQAQGNTQGYRAQSSKRSLALIQKSEANEGKPPMHV